MCFCHLAKPDSNTATFYLFPIDGVGNLYMISQKACAYVGIMY